MVWDREWRGRKEIKDGKEGKGKRRVKEGERCVRSFSS